jgi:hypothetical protein
MVALWRVEQLKPLVRGSIEHGTAPVMGWTPAECWGIHPSRVRAMRACVEGLDPDFTGAPDGLIRAQWRNWARSMGLRTAPARSTEQPATIWELGEALAFRR